MLTEKDTLSISAFLDHLQSWHHKTVFIYAGKVFSYQWLVKAAKQMAGWLVNNQYTALMFTTKNSPLTALLYLGGWLSSCKLYPVNPRLISHEVIQIIARANPSVLLIEPDQADKKLVDYCSEHNIVLEIIDSQLSFIENLPCIGAPTNADPISDQAITYHISSGTGGHYNFHGHTLSQILYYGYRRQFDLGLDSDDTLLIVLSLNHAYAFSYQLLPGLAMGLSMVLLPAFNAEAVKNAITHHNITAVALLPTMYYLLCQLIKNDKEYNHCLRLLSVAGDQVQAILVKMVEKTLRVSLKNGIGMSEVYGYGQNTQVTLPANKIKLFDEIECKINPLSLTEINRAAKTVIIGEIYLKTPTQPVGYTEKWLATGDLGYFDKQRYLHFFGRIKDIIVKGGSNISPIEIEHCLYQLSGIDEVAVVGRSHEIWGVLICACIVTTDNTTYLTKASINQYLSSYLALYKHIDEIYFMSALPKNSMAKLDRSALTRVTNG